MKASYFGTVGCFVCLLVLFVGVGASKDKCDGGAHPWTYYCTDHDGLKNSANVCQLNISGTCVLDISVAAGKPVVTQHNKGQSADAVCVKNKTTIQWSEKVAKSRYGINFGASSPFQDTSVLVGASGQPDSDVVDSGGGCYVYSIRHCIGAKPCTMPNPKVIVQGGAIGDH